MTAMLLEHFHGAVTRIPVEATAVPHRQPGHNFAITSVWTDPAATDDNAAWTRESFEAMAPYLTGRRYLNYFAEDDTGEAAAHAAYGPNYERLAKIKAAYDPDNVFRLNANVPPG
jgi:FAD/FMN-containing dehydrogenase